MTRNSSGFSFFFQYLQRRDVFQLGTKSVQNIMLVNREGGSERVLAYQGGGYQSFQFQSVRVCNVYTWCSSLTNQSRALQSSLHMDSQLSSSPLPTTQHYLSSSVFLAPSASNSKSVHRCRGKSILRPVSSPSQLITSWSFCNDRDRDREQGLNLLI